MGAPLDLAAPSNWLGAPYNGQPPNGTCTDCQVIIDCICEITSAFTAPLTFANGTGVSEIDILANATLTIKQWVVLDGTKVVVGSDGTSPASLIIDDEVDMISPAVIQLANSNVIVDANNAAGNPSHGFISPGDPAGNGIYYVTDFGNFPANGTYTIILGQFGYGDPLTPGLFFDPYTINCSPSPPPGNLCATGIVYGPAITKPDPAHPTIVDFQGNAPLPVVLTQFVASRSDDQTVKVSWATSQEENASHFEVERTSDVNGNWQTLGTVEAKGFSSITTNYSFNDRNPLDGTSYYRLKMVDLDGKYKYSKIATLSDIEGESLVIYNNPFTDMIRLKINTNSTDDLSITVSDVLGKVYLTQFVKARSGDNFVNINPGGAAGMYILHIQGRGYDRIVKLIKQ